ncbi:helix-turn-helix domain-containing protein [Aridibaculum aurantiacum]|uniref:helix-turn-helix domain-containing protein n=1 Tax=Aridibaculum aurantiacum TaxID=2810307 RepID=UPI001A96FBE9|nr:helix-turn-helix domain-containing protein [Aridibaculum aurantiacum]
MNEVLNMLIQLSQDFAVIKAYILSLKKSKLDNFNETWIDGQVVMQTMHLSKRTLQTLRDNGTLPYSRINGKFYYKVADVEQLLEANYSNSKSAGHGTK